MRILLKGKAEKRWRPLASSDYEDESRIQELLQNDISLIPLEPPLVASAREFGLPSSGSSDIVAVAEDGSIAIVECKLAKNSDVRRKVIGQLLEYAAYLSQMSELKFTDNFDKLSEKPLYESVREHSSIEFNELEFRKALDRNLREGRFHLIVAVDHINEELREIVLYLNKHSDCVVAALELEYFRDGEKEILVPKISGGPDEKEAAVGRGSVKRTYAPKENLNRETFQKTVGEEVAKEEITEEDAAVLRQLLDFAEKNADEIKWNPGCFVFRIKAKKIILPLLRVYTDAYLEFDFRSVLKSIGLKDTTEFRQRINAIGACLDEKRRDFEHFCPSTDLKFLYDASSFEAFKETILWVEEKMRAYKGD